MMEVETSVVVGSALKPGPMVGNTVLPMSSPITSPTAKVGFNDKWDSFLCTCFMTLTSLKRGASTVAIDNKIEQAMDLVKSHLMFAVREEVEVLREQIKELLEKNSQLEYENSILRAAVPPEILVKLSQPPLSAAACAAATHQHQPPPNLM